MSLVSYIGLLLAIFVIVRIVDAIEQRRAPSHDRPCDVCAWARPHGHCGHALAFFEVGGAQHMHTQLWMRLPASYCGPHGLLLSKVNEQPRTGR